MRRHIVPVVITVCAGALMAMVARPGVAQEPGTVSTVAGPGLCTGAGTVNPTSGAVRSLAVDGSGTVSFSTGPSGRGALARVDGEGRARLVPTGVAGERAFPLAPDRAGGVYAGADTRVLAISADDAAAVVAGDPNPGARAGSPGEGDGGAAAYARFGSIVGLASDESGNIYVADQAGAGPSAVRVRFVNRGVDPVVFYPGTGRELAVAGGHIDTIAGRGSPVGDVPALEGSLSAGSAALAAAPGRVYIAANPQGRGRTGPDITMLNLTGAPFVAHGVTVPAGGKATVAGGAPAGFGGDGGPALAASFSRVSGLAVDGSGNLLVADETNHRVRKVDTAGTITSVAGSGPVGPGAGGFNGNDRAGTDARLDHPSDVAVGPGSRVYIADRQNNQVRYLDPSGVIRSGRGNGIGLSWDCAPEGDAPAGPAGTVVPPLEGRPRAVAADGEGNVYLVSESLQHVKRRDPAGNITTVAGGNPGGLAPCRPGPAPGCATGDDQPAAAARLKRPTAVAVGRRGDLYVYDAGDARLRVVNLGSRPRRMHGVTVSPGTIHTVAGTGVAGTGGDGGPALAAQLSPQLYTSVAADGGGNVFLTDGSDTGGGRVRRIDAEGLITTVVRGPVASDPAAGCCKSPAGLAVDPAGNLYVSDTSYLDRRVWFVNLGPVSVTVHGRTVAPGASELVAGVGPAGFGGDGSPATEAELVTPVSLALDGAGNLYIADLAEHTVRRVDRDGTISTAMGTGTPGFNGDGLKGPLTFLASPAAVAVDRCDNLLVADLGNDRVRRLPLADRCPSAGEVSGRGSYLPVALGVLLAVAVVVAAGATVTVRKRARRGA